MTTPGTPRYRTWFLIAAGGVILPLLIVAGFFAGKSFREASRSESETSPPTATQDPEVEIKFLAEDLKAKDPEKRVNALIRLAEFGGKANIVGKQVVEAMLDKVPAVRNAAVDTIEKIDPIIHRQVVTIISGKNASIALSELKSLGNRAKIALPILFELVTKADKVADPEEQPLLIDSIASIAPKDERLATVILNYVRTPLKSVPVRQPAPITNLVFRYRVFNHHLIAKRDIGLKYLDIIDAKSEVKMDALVSALKVEVADSLDNEVEELNSVYILPVITALAGYGKDAALALPTLKKLSLLPDVSLRQATTEAIKKIE
jgi:hypothetical protein